jgi:hypothetical protein
VDWKKSNTIRLNSQPFVCGDVAVKASELPLVCISPLLIPNRNDFRFGMGYFQTAYSALMRRQGAFILRWKSSGGTNIG